MTRRTIVGIGVTSLAVIIALFFFLSSFNSAGTSAPKTGKESMDECCKKKGDAETNQDIDFETLSGKFFSSALY